ncbi:hypothetical protein MSAR_23890 [Mycolicibacterium sarraceniae]|uniref:Uncharacterized protein n=1 Tax=Mycolicibacterium sarraceniae TaxID=1534348 RepID=A0A7I7SR97_9MYCO|nr:hypothetical protein MSAR_23890 [Mycolicibacterium sarraceniae]
MWSAEPGIDLTTGRAVVARAYIESYFLALAMGTVDVTYPGFQQSLPPRPADGGALADEPWPGTQHPAPYPVVGTIKEHVLRLDNSGQTTVAIVCGFDYGYGVKRGDGVDSHNSGSAYDGVGAVRIQMAGNPQPGQPLPPQRGPSAAPIASVFSGLRIESRVVGDQSDTPQWPTREADIQDCRDRAPDPIERRKFLLQGKHPLSDYPTLAPYPGWPEAGPP